MTVTSGADCHKTHWERKTAHESLNTTNRTHRETEQRRKAVYITPTQPFPPATLFSVMAYSHYGIRTGTVGGTGNGNRDYSSPYSEIGDVNFKCALWNFKQQLALKIRVHCSLSGYNCSTGEWENPVAMCPPAPDPLVKWLCNGSCSQYHFQSWSSVNSST